MLHLVCIGVFPFLNKCAHFGTAYSSAMQFFIADEFIQAPTNPVCAFFMMHSHTHTGVAPVLISPWFLCLSLALVAESSICLVHFLWFNCRLLQEQQPHTALPVSTFPVFDQTWHIMHTEDDLGQLADMTRNLFSLWISFLLAQQAAGLACVPWEAAPLLISFSFILGRPKRSLLIVVGSPKQKNYSFCWRE